MSVLDPLAERYAGWLAMPAEQITNDEDPAQVRAMQMVLRLERQDPPGRTPLLEAAAAAAIAVCLDPRSEEGGEWHDAVAAWVAGRIRKVARRARGAHWQAVQEQPGITVEVDGAEVRALVPSLVAELPKEVSRLQISGSDLPPDDPGPPPADIPLLLLNPGVPMTTGKAAAQVGHATMLLATALPPEQLEEWASTGYRCAVRTPSQPDWDRHFVDEVPSGGKVMAVRDAGFTEIAPGTITVLARLPEP